MSSKKPHCLFLALKDEHDDDAMEKAFRELDKLESIDDDVEIKTPDLEKAMQEIDSTLFKKDTPKVKPEEEIKRYTKMYQEEADQDENDLYSNVMKDMGGTPKPSKTTEDVVVPKVSTSDNSMDEFMNAALEQALKEAKDKTPEEIASLSENILDDEEMMDEIRNVFEKANKELLEGLDEIRQEQSDLAKASAEKNSQDRIMMEKENEIRMAKAQESMETMLKTVNKESLEVEKAMEDLQKAQNAMNDDPMMKLASGDIVKQASLVGALLFTVRAGAETIAIVGGGGSDHAVAALVQGAIAIACAVIFFS